jgi:hypothetical protein
MIESDKTCDCGHLGSRHFWTTDEIGYWAFCTIDTCECFLDRREEDDEVS